jgi:hypothetical protein
VDSIAEFAPDICGNHAAAACAASASIWTDFAGAVGALLGLKGRAGAVAHLPSSPSSSSCSSANVSVACSSHSPSHATGHHTGYAIMMLAASFMNTLASLYCCDIAFVVRVLARTRDGAAVPDCGVPVAEVGAVSLASLFLALLFCCCPWCGVRSVLCFVRTQSIHVVVIKNVAT